MNCNFRRKLLHKVRKIHLMMWLLVACVEVALCSFTMYNTTQFIIHKPNGVIRLETRRSIIVFTTDYKSVSCARSFQSIALDPSSVRPILRLYTQLRSGLHTGLFPFVFSLQILCAFLLSPMLSMYPSNFIHLDLIFVTKLDEKYKLRSS